MEITKMKWTLFNENDKNTHPPVGSICLIHLDDKPNYVFGYKVVKILGYHMDKTDDQDPIEFLRIECKDLDADEYNPDFERHEDALMMWDIDIKKYIILKEVQDG